MLPYIEIPGLIALIIIAGRGVWVLSSLHTIVEGIKTNDLPHFEHEIRELKGAFIAHLEGHK